MRYMCILPVSFFLGVLTVSCNAQDSRKCTGDEVGAALREIAAEEPGGDRFDKSMIVAARLENAGPVCATDEDIASLSGQLRDKDDSVRASAAAIIESIGQAGRPAVPALERALAERPCEDRNLSSAAAIRVALEKLGEKPAKVMPFSCRNPAVR